VRGRATHEGRKKHTTVCRRGPVARGPAPRRFPPGGSGRSQAPQQTVDRCCCRGAPAIPRRGRTGMTGPGVLAREERRPRVGRFWRAASPGDLSPSVGHAASPGCPDGPLCPSPSSCSRERGRGGRTCRSPRNSRPARHPSGAGTVSTADGCWAGRGRDRTPRVAREDRRSGEAVAPNDVALPASCSSCYRPSSSEA
jgi:hypothetical protein